jgi:hypothetical protein
MHWDLLCRAPVNKQERMRNAAWRNGFAGAFGADDLLAPQRHVDRIVARFVHDFLQKHLQFRLNGRLSRAALSKVDSFNFSNPTYTNLKDMALAMHRDKTTSSNLY